MGYRISRETADEAGYDKSNLQNAADHLFKTATGKELLRSVYGI